MRFRLEQFAVAVCLSVAAVWVGGGLVTSWVLAVVRRDLEQQRQAGLS